MAWLSPTFAKLLMLMPSSRLSMALMFRVNNCALSTERSFNPVKKECIEREKAIRRMQLEKEQQQQQTSAPAQCDDFGLANNATTFIPQR